MPQIEHSADIARPMTPNEAAWVRAQRITEEDEEACRAPGVAEGTCAYAGPLGLDGCGAQCRYRPTWLDGKTEASDDRT